MSFHHPARRALFAVAVSISAIASAQGSAPLPGSFAAVDAVRHPARVQAAAEASVPQSSAIEVQLAAKNPSRYALHLAATGLPAGYTAPEPGSPQALLAVKQPARFGWHPAPGEAVTAVAAHPVAGCKSC